jgi:signal transduction histidine kinase
MGRVSYMSRRFRLSGSGATAAPAPCVSAYRWVRAHISERHLGMRLSSKIFLTSTVVIVVLVGVGAFSLAALSQLVSVNRGITTRSLPAMTLTASANAAMPSLLQLEARALVLRDPRYLTAWTRIAAGVAEDLDGLAQYSLGEHGHRLHREASEAFGAYQLLVAEEQALLHRNDRAGALRLADDAARARAEEAREHLDSLLAVIRTELLAAQEDAARLEARTWTVVLVALSAAVGLALLATALVARRMTRSLQRLSEATSAVATNEFREPIAIDSLDEIGALASSFNSMANRLRQMEQAKQDFFATVSHELRSPLTSIQAATQLLLQQERDPLSESQKRLTGIVAQSSERLLRLANQILEISRLRAEAARLDRQAVDLGQVVDRAVEELHPQAEDRGVALVAERSGAYFAYFGDEERLHRMIVNLGANAIRFTPRGGRVVVRVVDAGPEFEVQVEDNGVGIPADALPHIFDPYRQAHSDRGGIGLGLAIVQGVANVHGGRVTAESREGKGSRFTVLLPRPA